MTPHGHSAMRKPMLDTQRSIRAADELIDPAVIVGDLKKLAKTLAARARTAHRGRAAAEIGR